MAIVSKQCWTKFTVNNKINSSWLQYFIFVFTDEFPISESGVAFENLPSFKFYFEIQFRMQTVSGSIPWVRHCVAWDQTTSARAPGVSKLIITPHSNHIKCDVQAHIRLPLDEYLWNSTLGFDLNQGDESCCWNHWLVVCVRALGQCWQVSTHVALPWSSGCHPGREKCEEESRLGSRSSATSVAAVSWRKLMVWLGRKLYTARPKM